MNFKFLKQNVEEVLAQHGWSKERNIKRDLKFTSDKKVFPIFLDIAHSFVGLELKFKNKWGNESGLYFDLDESNTSKDIRAGYYNYNGHLDPNWLADVDYHATENFEISSIINSKVGKVCSRIGFWDDYDTGFDLYVTIDGEIYAANYDDPIYISQSFEEFLNQNVCGVQKSKSLN
jgi:hypothetical protein